jgi:hypothetical protein
MNEDYGNHGDRTLVSPESPMIVFPQRRVVIGWSPGDIAVEVLRERACSHDSRCTAWRDRAETINLFLELDMVSFIADLSKLVS